MPQRERRIPLQGPVCVDIEDQHLLLSRKWQRRNGYVICNNRSGRLKGVALGGVLLHRVIAGASKGQVVDHVNRDILDNRRSNLRLCTVAENNRNSVRGPVSAGGYRGVSRKRRLFYARIRVDGKKVHLGYFQCASDAAAAYDAAALKYHGEFAVTNAIRATLPPHDATGAEAEC